MSVNTTEKILVFPIQKTTHRLFIILSSIAVSLVFLDLIINYAEMVPLPPIQRIFNIAREDSLSNFISSVQELIVGSIVWCIFANRRTWGWAITACLFTYIGLDDGASIHERVGTAFKMVMVGEGDQRLGFYSSYPWQVVFLPIFGSMGLVMIHTVWKEVKDQTAWIRFVIAFACYVAAVGLDFVEGKANQHSEISTWLSQHWFTINDYSVRHFSKVIEEFLEFYGTSMFLLCFLQHLMQSVPDLRVKTIKP